MHQKRLPQIWGGRFSKLFSKSIYYLQEFFLLIRGEPGSFIKDRRNEFVVYPYFSASAS
jgi:hypothetical protein